MEELDIKKKRVMIYFIEATEKLMREDSIDGLSIRKIASEAGYNSATIYNYFSDLEHLILFASVNYLREYTKNLGEKINSNMTTLEKYREVYYTFNYNAFRSPEIFHNMFFGKYSSRLGDVIKIYYELFPENLEGHEEIVRTLLTGGDMYSRDDPFVKQLVKEKIIDSNKVRNTLDILVNTQQSYIYKSWMLGDRLDLDEHNEAFMEIFDYVMEMAKCEEEN